MTDTTKRAELLALADRLTKQTRLELNDLNAVRDYLDADSVLHHEVASALRRLAAQDQKPVAWLQSQNGVEIVSKHRLDPDASKFGWTERPLYLSPPPAAGVRVKPLEWRDHSFEGSLLWIATTPFDDYLVSKEDMTWPYVVRPFRTPQSNYQTLEEAKAACEADYERRVLSALSHQPAAAETNASAEARLREVLEAVRFNLIHFAKYKTDSVLIEGIDKALSAHPHASAEARMREALRDLVWLVSTDRTYDDSESLRSARNILFAENKTAMLALSAHPHASETKDVDWDDVRGIAPDATGDLSSEEFIRQQRDEWRDPHASDCDKQGCMGDTSPGDAKDLQELLSKPSVLEPSDRTADVTEDQMARAWKSEQNRYEILIFGGNRPCQVTCDGSLAFTGADEDCETFIRTRCARALLDAFTVGRR